MLAEALDLVERELVGLEARLQLLLERQPQWHEARRRARHPAGGPLVRHEPVLAQALDGPLQGAPTRDQGRSGARRRSADRKKAMVVLFRADIHGSEKSCWKICSLDMAVQMEMTVAVVEQM